MRKLLAISGKLLFVVLLCLSLGTAQAEDATFSEAELDQMMAPIALYPDALLAQILMATTYPADVTEAVKWSKDNPKQEGDAAVEAVQDKSWDPSVMSLVAFPQVLTMMGEQPDWVQNTGDAFLADSETVMDTVQKLRKKAKDEGNLETTEQQKVVVEEPAATETGSTETVIIIEPATVPTATDSVPPLYAALVLVLVSELPILSGVVVTGAVVTAELTSTLTGTTTSTSIITRSTPTTGIPTGTIIQTIVAAYLTRIKKHGISLITNVAEPASARITGAVMPSAIRPEIRWISAV